MTYCLLIQDRRLMKYNPILQHSLMYQSRKVIAEMEQFKQKCPYSVCESVFCNFFREKGRPFYKRFYR